MCDAGDAALSQNRTREDGRDAFRYVSTRGGDEMSESLPALPVLIDDGDGKAGKDNRTKVGVRS
jgi:hypothetical protein